MQWLAPKGITTLDLEPEFFSGVTTPALNEYASRRPSCLLEWIVRILCKKHGWDQFFYQGSGIKILGKMGLRDQNEGKKIGISGTRIYHVTTLIFMTNVCDSRRNRDKCMHWHESSKMSCKRRIEYFFVANFGSVEIWKYVNFFASVEPCVTSDCCQSSVAF